MNCRPINGHIFYRVTTPIMGIAWRRIFLIIFLLAPVCLLAQTSGTLSGKVIEAKTKKPIPFASIFLANTMMGTSSDADGSYRITNIPQGKYDITVSSVGYVVRQVSISIASEPVELVIELKEDVRYLKEVTIKPKHIDLQKWIAMFKAYFVGQTSNARECTILNLDKIDFDYDEEEQLFTASCTEPIQVENKGLGYKLYYLLQEFTVDFKKSRYIIGGIPRFEELSPHGDGQRRHWLKERDLTYFGSLNHFMKSLKGNRLKTEDFEVNELCDKTRKKVNLDSTFAMNGHSQVVAYCPLEIIYRGVWPHKVSVIKLLDGVITVHENGYYEDQLRVDLGGFYGRTEKVAAEMLPLEYEPFTKPK